jgi:hypothetical protein
MRSVARREVPSEGVGSAREVAGSGACIRGWLMPACVDRGVIEADVLIA